MIELPNGEEGPSFVDPARVLAVYQEGRGDDAYTAVRIEGVELVLATTATPLEVAELVRRSGEAPADPALREALGAFVRWLDVMSGGQYAHAKMVLEEELAQRGMRL